MHNNLCQLNKRGWRADFFWLAQWEKVVRGFLKNKIKNRQISVALVDSREMRRLNKIYRRQDKITDVLSFSLLNREELGEVLICLPRAKQQARRKGHSLRVELQLLITHGCLHLLGYDHERGERAAQRQESLENKILAKLN